MIRKATNADLDGIMVVIEDGRKALKSLGLSQWNGPLGYPNRGNFIKDIEDGGCFIALDNNEVVGTETLGFAFYEYSIAGDTVKWLIDTKNYVAIHRFCVRSDYKGLGFSHQLLEQALNFAKENGCLSVRIDTHPGNIAMQKLLLKEGFTNCGYVIYDYIPVEPKRLVFEKLVK